MASKFIDKMRSIRYETSQREKNIFSGASQVKEYPFLTQRGLR